MDVMKQKQKNLSSIGNNQLSEEAAHRMGENCYQLSTWQRVSIQSIETSKKSQCLSQAEIVSLWLLVIMPVEVSQIKQTIAIPLYFPP